MAEDNIDKALPNEPRKTFEVPGEEEVQEQIVETVEEQQGYEPCRYCLLPFIFSNLTVLTVL